MRYTLLALLLMPVFSFAGSANVYNLAVCLFAKAPSATTWSFEGAGNYNQGLTTGQAEALGVDMGDGNGLCELATGLASASQVQVTFVTGSGGSDFDITDPNTCTFTGTNVKTSTTTKTIGYDQFVYSETSLSSTLTARDVIYLATPAEATNTNWVTTACANVQKNMPN